MVAFPLDAGFWMVFAIDTTGNALHLKCAPELTEHFRFIISLASFLGKGKQAPYFRNAGGKVWIQGIADCKCRHDVTFFSFLRQVFCSFLAKIKK